MLGAPTENIAHHSRSILPKYRNVCDTLMAIDGK